MRVPSVPSLRARGLAALCAGLLAGLSAAGGAQAQPGRHWRHDDSPERREAMRAFREQIREERMHHRGMQGTDWPGPPGAPDMAQRPPRLSPEEREALRRQLRGQRGGRGESG